MNYLKLYFIFILKLYWIKGGPVVRWAMRLCNLVGYTWKVWNSKESSLQYHNELSVETCGNKQYKNHGKPKTWPTAAKQLRNFLLSLQKIRIEKYSLLKRKIDTCGEFKR